VEIARLYRDAQRSFVELVASFDADDWATPVPCTPGWTAHDVLSHVAGVTDDVINGRVDGAATEPWTAAQVERWRGTPRSELIEQWNHQTAQVADAFEAIGERRPPVDCHMHEHDVRQAIDRPGERNSEIVTTMVRIIADEWQGRPIEIRFADGSTLVTAGTGTPRQLSGVTQFDIARSYMGRRSGAQVEAWAWSDRLDPSVLADWFTFGPSVVDIDE